MRFMCSKKRKEKKVALVMLRLAMAYRHKAPPNFVAMTKLLVLTHIVVLWLTISWPRVGIPKTIAESKTTIIVNHMQTIVASTCMHVIHNGGHRFGDGFGYTYLTTSF